MRILYFSPRDCWPANTGARVRDYNLARQLASRAELTYLGFSQDRTQRSVTSGQVGADLEIRQILAPPPARYSIPMVLRGFIGPVPLTVLNYTTPAMLGELRRLLDEEAWDFVQLEGIHLSAYLSVIRAAESKPRILCDWHNIESELMERFSGNPSTPWPRRVYGKRTAGLLYQHEHKLLESCDAHTVCSDRERAVLLARKPGIRIATIPNGVDVNSFGSAPEGTHAGPVRDIVFVGSMDYHANIDAVTYFAREIWPSLRQELPEYRFVVVGSRPVPEVLALASEPGIVVTGTVEDVRPYYRNAAVVVVPLRVGSGTRLKLVEAMAAGAAIVSTTLGAEGIDSSDGRDLIIADNPARFAETVKRIAADPALRERLASAARDLAVERYDWATIGNHLADFYAEQ